MKITREESLNNFEFWGGAKDRANCFSWEELEQIEQALEEIYGETIDETTINDLFWFEIEFLCSLIGLEYDEEKDEPKREQEEDEEE